MTDDEKELRRLFRYLTTSVYHANLLRFMLLSEKIYDVNYNDGDLDEIIDAVDYGTGRLSFHEFDLLMKKEKKKKCE